MKLFLLCLLLACTVVSNVRANVEKIVFSYPLSAELDSLHVGNASAIAELSIKSPILRDKINIADGEIKYYQLQLQPGRWEVRVCWQATAPTDWELTLFKPPETLGRSSPMIRVQGVPSYVPVNPTHVVQEVPFVLVLDRHLLGFIPKSTVPTLAIVALVLVVAWLWIVPFVQKALMEAIMKEKTS
ncbi:hypothetical protein BC832DRAFT_44745 [Gaertneriomyces semiglobifer]|nr:hypothetical protein BC832DRAFT_44745 [Gaertneriomyces semiglobifer]